MSFYLDFAELQASNEKPMRMKDWINKLDEFLKLSEKGILDNAGKVSAKEAQEKAELEFKKYKKMEYQTFESDFDREVKKLLSRKKKNYKK